MQPLGANHRKAGVGIPQHQQRIRLSLPHQLIGFRNDVSHRLTEIFSHRIQIDFRIFQFQIFKKNAVQVIVVILPRMCQNRIKIFPALPNHGGKPNDLRSRSHHDQQL